MATHSPKRAGSPLDAIHNRAPKKPQNVQGTLPSQPVAVPLEFVPENRLPHTQELECLNRLIHSDLQTWIFSSRAINRYSIPLILSVLEKRCHFLDMQHPWIEDAQALHAAEIVSITQDAYQRADYSRLMLFKRAQRSPPPPRTPFPSSIPREVQEAIVGGWSAPFIGTAHIALAKNIRQMFKEARRDSDSHKYMTHASIIQSSGSGKSRLLDKVAETIFTIPFNVRDPSEASGGAWPPADCDIHYWMLTWTRQQNKMSLCARYLCFFTAVFEEVRKEIEQHIPQAPSGSTASAWRTHLAESWSEHRNDLYDRVVKSDTVRKSWALSYEDLDYATLAALRKTAKEALEHLLDKVCPDEACRTSHTEKRGSTEVENIHVLMYFDEAHALTHPLSQSDGSRYEDKTTLDVLCTVFDDFRHLGLFGVFVSTQPHLEHFQSKASRAPYSASARSLVSQRHAHAPITETPFDCFADRPIIPSRLRADDLCDIPFMACFGRPMWRSLLLPFCNDILADATNTAPQDPSRPPYNFREPIDRLEHSWRLLDLAQSKLVFHTDLNRGRHEFSQAAQIAVLDVRILLPFEPRAPSAHCLQMELVASHMRTIYYIPRHREFASSGYPSEPILAEAAARQMHAWRKADEHSAMLQDPTALVLRDAVERGLLEREGGEIGEAVGRLLLTLARDRAVLDVQVDKQPLLFSRAVPVTAFIQALFPPVVAQAVLDSTPDNLPSGGYDVPTRTFAETFKDAVLNFTHFARWEDGAVPDERAAVGCFVRSMAVVCRKNPSMVDAFIPVLLDRSAHLRGQVMSGILVRFNSKAGKSGAAKTTFPIDEEDIGLFDSELNCTLADAPMASPRPYITLVMELGVGVDEVDPLSSYTNTGSVGESPAPVPVDVSHWRSTCRDWAHDDGTRKVRHPRYSMTAYGCSPAVYGVMRKDDPVLYKAMLRNSTPLSEHARQDADSLDLVRMLKPAFSTEDASWDWIANAHVAP